MIAVTVPYLGHVNTEALVAAYARCAYRPWGTWLYRPWFYHVGLGGATSYGIKAALLGEWVKDVQGAPALFADSAQATLVAISLCIRDLRERRLLDSALSALGID